MHLVRVRNPLPRNMISEENGDDLYVKFGNGDTVEGLYTDKELTKPAFNDGTLFVYEWPHIALYDGDWTKTINQSCCRW